MGRGDDIIIIKSYFEVLGICCTSEVPIIEKILKALVGVMEVKVIVPSKTVIVLHDPFLVSHLHIGVSLLLLLHACFFCLSAVQSSAAFFLPYSCYRATSIAGKKLHYLLDHGMPSDRLLAKILSKNKDTVNNVKNEDLTPSAAIKDSPPHNTRPKRSANDAKSPTVSPSSKTKKLKLSNTTTNPQTSSKDSSKKPTQNETPSGKPIIVEIDSSARWTSGTAAPLDSLTIFKLPGDVDSYKNVKNKDLIDRTRRRFGRFASDFVHAIDAFEKLDHDNNSQKISKEITLLKETRQNLQQQLHQAKEKITELMNNRTSWEADRVKLNSDNKWLAQDKAKLQNEVADWKTKMEIADREVKQLREQMTLIEDELKKAQANLAEAEDESMSLLEEGYNICLAKFKDAGISIEGKTYQDYLKEMEEARKTTSTGEQSNDPVNTSPQEETHPATPTNNDNLDADNQKAGNAP